ncbi:hypothetical protein P7H60_08500 [Vagococcus carniphilus]|uniref:hypothetical protein n=1 Tax=Vagococcus carniphilus TaxID=218144 RepID=UPI00288F6D0E|nr:hypothetical protein [Vagococcus carniphilus]MDT2815167.1 hypothetical protein [Vagococcus carniphilus]MDT2849202.1 hypothetical protein [Vagococcus carniphilus]MDT2866093.1 hypothetical protein [Vagococcus carniphilus]
MINYYKKFSKQHPYWHVILVLVLASLVGILIEYVVNKNFIGSGIYATFFLGLIEIIRVRKNNLS